MSEDNRDLIGRWVEVLTGRPVGITGVSHREFGVLLAFDEAGLLLEKSDGETLYFFPDNIVRVTLIPSPTSHADTLVRPADRPPEEEPLLRPSHGVTDADDERLVRPSSSQDPIEL